MPGMRCFNIFRRSLLLKIDGIAIIIITVTLALFGLYEYRNTERKFRRDIEERCQIATERLAVSLSSPLFTYETKTIEGIILAEMKLPILEGIFLNEPGKPLYGWIRAQDGGVVNTEELLSTTTNVMFELPIYQADGIALGNVMVYMTLKTMFDELQHSLRTIILEICVLDMLIAIGLTVVMRVILLLPLTRIVEFVQLIASGDVTQTLHNHRMDELGRLVQAMNQMVIKLRATLTDMKNGADSVAAGSRQMNSAAERISQGASEQSAAIEEVSASIEQMLTNIRQNSDNAVQTGEIAIKAAEDARTSGDIVNETASAMQEIAQKISVIEEISSQTRLLSLNATIEAARAQEYGKGFGVVAAEVRNLASQTQEVAQAITGLTQSGTTIAEQAGQRLQCLVPEIQKTADLIQQISIASQEQHNGASQVSRAILQLDAVIQQNAASSEDMEALSEEFAKQAAMLQNASAFFKTTTDVHASKCPDRAMTKETVSPGKNARATTRSIPVISQIKNRIDYEDGFEYF